MANKLRLPCLLLMLCLLLAKHVHALVGADTERASSGGSNSLSSDADSKIYRRPKIINCNFACSRRCKAASRTGFCKRACGTCCARCQCVPAGTYGNHHMCPCYASLTTHGRRPKCP